MTPWCWPPWWPKSEAKPGQDFFPDGGLSRNLRRWQDPGSFFKREGRPANSETLTSRLIDRPIRPLFPKASSTKCRVITPCR